MPYQPIPHGYDRADGVTVLPGQPYTSPGSSTAQGRAGTQTPSGALIVQGPTGSGFVLQEDPTSPEIERAEQATAQHTLREMVWSDAWNLLTVLGRGTFVSDSLGNIWRILSSKIRSVRGGNAELSYTAEATSFDSPPDDFQITPVELGVDIIKYPRYFYALYPSTNNPFDNTNDYTVFPDDLNPTVSVAQIKQAIIRAIQTYRDSPYFPQQGQLTTNGVTGNNIISMFVAGTIGVPIPGTSEQGAEVMVSFSGNGVVNLALAAAKEIIQKLWFQLDTPYLAGFQISWTQYFFQPVYENPGGYIEDPTFFVPDYFMQPSAQATLARGFLGSAYGNADTLPPVNGPSGVGGATIFDYMSSINPQCFSSTGYAGVGLQNISWLRKADEVVFERTWFKVTRTWIGSPIGHWDAQIYQQGRRPIQVSDYQALV